MAHLQYRISGRTTLKLVPDPPPYNVLFSHTLYSTMERMGKVKQHHQSVVHEFLRLWRSASLVAGIALLWSTNYSALVGNLTGQGTTIFQWLGPQEETLTQGTLHAAAFIEEAPTGGATLLMGIFLVLLGFLLHALLVVQRERPVHITVRKPNVQRSHYTEWFWMEIWP